MQNLLTKYQETFPNPKMESIYTEGVENCVTKNLYQVLFGDIGVGNQPNQTEGQNAAHATEIEHNRLISQNINKFGEFVLPRHLDIPDERLIEAKIESACH